MYTYIICEKASTYSNPCDALQLLKCTFHGFWPNKSHLSCCLTGLTSLSKANIDPCSAAGFITNVSRFLCESTRSWVLSVTQNLITCWQYAGSQLLSTLNLITGQCCNLTQQIPVSLLNLHSIATFTTVSVSPPRAPVKMELSTQLCVNTGRTLRLVGHSLCLADEL